MRHPLRWDNNRKVGGVGRYFHNTSKQPGSCCKALEIASPEPELQDARMEA